MTAAPLDLQNRLALSIGEAATVLGVSERHVRQLLHELPHVYLGGRVVIPVEPLREYLRNRARQPEAAQAAAVTALLNKAR